MMAHLSPPPSPPITTSSKLLNVPTIMNGLDKLYASMSSSSIIQRANLNTALRQNLNRGMSQWICFHLQKKKHSLRNSLRQYCIRSRVQFNIRVLLFAYTQ